MREKLGHGEHMGSKTTTGALEVPQDMLGQDGMPPRRNRIWVPWRSRQLRGPWRSRVLRRPWWSRGLRRPWRSRGLQGQWQDSLHGLGPRAGPYGRTPIAPQKNSLGEIRGLPARLGSGGSSGGAGTGAFSGLDSGTGALSGLDSRTGALSGLDWGGRVSFSAGRGNRSPLWAGRGNGSPLSTLFRE